MPGSFPARGSKGGTIALPAPCPSQAAPGIHPCGSTGLGWRSCRVRLGKTSGLWAAEGAEVEAIANVAESAHGDVAAP